MANAVVIYVDEKAYSHEDYVTILMGKAVAAPEKCKGVRLLEFKDSLSDLAVCDEAFTIMNRMKGETAVELVAEAAWWRANQIRCMSVGDRVVIQRWNEEKQRTDARTYRCSPQGWEEELPILH